MKKLTLLAACCVAACHHESSSHLAPEPSPSPSQVALDAGAVSTAKDSGACSAIARARATYDGGPHDAVGATLDCKVTKHGAWGVFSSTLNAEPMYVDALEVNFAYATNGQATIQPQVVWSAIDRVALFDFDADGEEELIFEGKNGCGMRGEVFCRDPRPILELLTVKNGKIEPFFPKDLIVPPGLEQSHLGMQEPGKITRFDSTLLLSAAPDIDGDGRPDLATNLFYEMSVSDGDVTAFSINGPRFIAHALANGGFSFTDDVAMGALRADCDSAVPFEKVDGAGMLKTSVCARLRGKSVGEIKQRYGTRCSRILAENKRLEKQNTNDGTDFYATGSCRTEPEGGWSGAHGIPVAIGKMLEETQPLLVKQ